MNANPAANVVLVHGGDLCGYDLLAGMWVHLQVGSRPYRPVTTGGHPGGRGRASAAGYLRREDAERECPHVHVAPADQPARPDDS
jgi:hypothetical protein